MKQTFIKKEGHPRLMLFLPDGEAKKTCSDTPWKKVMTTCFASTTARWISTIPQSRVTLKSDCWHGRWVYGWQAGSSRGIPSRGK